MSSLYDRVRDNNDRLALQYDTAKPDVAALLDTLHDDVLPQLVLELELADPDVASLSEWLSDVASVFRLLRRHKFIRPFALQEIRAVSIWRLRVLRPALRLPVPALFHCLPPPITDPFGHPLVFLKLASLQSSSRSAKDALLQGVERLRLHLRYLFDHCPHAGTPPLQYLVLLDLDGVSIRNPNLDLCSWFLTDIIPRYPGMLAAVFVLNYSWLHSGAWSVASRVLPSSTIARVFFPSREQLLNYCSAATLPAEYGGSLPTLDQIDDALCHLPPPPPPPLSLLAAPPANLPITTPPQLLGKRAIAPLCRVPSTIALPPLSPRNPFFGYPVSVSATRPHTVRHVRKGLGDLAHTLAVLWWRRWGRWVWLWTCAAALLVLVRRTRRGPKRRWGV